MNDIAPESQELYRLVSYFRASVRATLRATFKNDKDRAHGAAELSSLLKDFATEVGEGKVLE